MLINLFTVLIVALCQNITTNNTKIQYNRPTIQCLGRAVEGDGKDWEGD